MRAPAVIMKLLVGGLILGVASLAAGSVFAFQHGWATSLGHPLIHLGSWPLYSPLAIWQWAWWWGWAAPRHFQLSGLVGGGLLLGIGLLLGSKRPPKGGVARWATTADLQAAALYAPHGMVLGKRRGQQLRYDGPAHMLAVAPTRSGKTTSTGIPTCFE
jgi:type IV secretion system protein VirD4